MARARAPSQPLCCDDKDDDDALTRWAQALSGRGVPLVPERLLESHGGSVFGQLLLHGRHRGLQRGHAALHRTVHVPCVHRDRQAQSRGSDPAANGGRPPDRSRLPSFGRRISCHVHRGYNVPGLRRRLRRLGASPVLRARLFPGLRYYLRLHSWTVK